MLCLPNEVLLHIIDGIPNADLDNFTSSCKLIHSLAYNVLRDHQKRKRTYSSITYGYPVRNGEASTWSHPTLMLRDLQRDDLLCYSTMLSINGHDYEGDGGRYYSVNDVSNGVDCNSEVDYALEHFPKDIGPLVKACPYIDGDEELTNAFLEDGDSGATLALLLNILPRLTDLEVTEYCEASDGGVNLRQILDRMVSDSNSSMSGAQGESKNSGCNLKNIRLVYSNEGLAPEGGWSSSMHPPLFYTPSVRSIHIECLSSHKEVWNYPGLRSRVERLDFYRPSTDIKSMETYLGAVTNLADFRYVSGYVNVPDGHDLLLIDLVRLLAVHAGHSLRHLELRDEYVVGGGVLFLGSLRTFQVLQSIKTEVAMLIQALETEDIHQVHGGRPGSTQQLADTLPASLIYLTLCSTWKSHRSLDMTDFIQTPQDLPTRKIEALPGLRAINLEFRCPRFKKDEMALLRACGEAGVTMSDCDGPLN